MKERSSLDSHPTGAKPSLYRRIRQNHLLQKILRVFQFLSSVISLGLFSARLYRILRTVQRATASNGAVEGILAAAVAYTLLSMILKFLLKSGGPKWLRLLWIVFDLAFVGGFIAVAYLTSPGGNKTSGPCHSVRGVRLEPNGSNCNLPWGTFILAIASTWVALLFLSLKYVVDLFRLLHSLTALFNEARDSYKTRHHADKYDSRESGSI